MSTREHLLQMLSMSNTVVGHINNTDEPSMKAEGCWDRDTLTNLGFTNIQVGITIYVVDHRNQDQGVLLAEVERKVQGMCSTNPFKLKRKTVGTECLQISSRGTDREG